MHSGVRYLTALLQSDTTAAGPSTTVTGTHTTATSTTPNATGALSQLHPWTWPALRDVPPGVRDPLVAVVILVLGWYAAKLTVRLAGRTIARRIRRPSVTRTVLRGVRMLVLGLAVATAASRVGFTAGNILLSVTVFSAVLGIVLAPIVGSIVNGIFVLADQPYEIGDMIQLADRQQTGFVEDITIRYTKIFTLDNTFIVIPNDSIRNRDVINYSAEDERTRLSITVQVTYESDVSEARDLMERAGQNVEEVITGGPDIRIGSARYPAAPTCYLDEYADSGIDLTLRYWAKQPYKLLTLRSKVQTNVWDALDEAENVEIAYPHQHLVFDETSGTASVSLRDGRGAPGDAGVAPGDVEASETDASDRSDGVAGAPDEPER